MTTEQAQHLVTMTLANFPHLQDKAMTPTVSLWKMMLQDIPYPTLEASLIKVLATSKYWPNVAEIREAALSLTGNKAPAALEAWGMVREAIKRDKPASTLHPAIQQAIKAFGGLDGIGYSEDIKYIQGQFLKLYDELATKENHYEVLPDSVKQFISGAEVKRLA